MKQVNLQEVLLNVFIQYKADYPENRLSKTYTIEQFQNATEILTVGMSAMQKACNQTVDLCAENVILEWNSCSLEHQSDSAKFDNTQDCYINKQSILDTKKQII